jgi:HK97 family phage prohead protease
MTVMKSTKTQFKLRKDDAGQPTGEVEFYAAKFGNVDLVGDRMVKGSFANTLEAWREKGAPIPIVFSHKWDDPFSLIGYADPKNVTEDDAGLLVKGTLDIDDNPTAKQVWKNMSRKTLNEASFAYDVKSESGLKKGRDGANDIYEVDLLEVGPTLKGANPDTVGVLSAKARAASESKSTSVDGSIEATQSAILAALPDSNDNTYSYIFATFLDHVIVSTFDSSDDQNTYQSYPYTLNSDGTATLGTPTNVEVETTVTATPSKDAEPDGTKAASDDDSSSKDPAQELFDLSDKQHTAIAVAIVFGAADERNGKPKPQADWSYRGGNPGADLTAAQISTVVSRVRAAASKFDVPLTAPKDDAGKSAAATDVNVKAGARHSAADAKHVQAIHDQATALGASCDPDTGEGKNSVPDGTKSADPGLDNEQPNDASDGADPTLANDPDADQDDAVLIGQDSDGNSLYVPKSVLAQVSTVAKSYEDDTEDSQSSGDEGDSEGDEESDDDSKSVSVSDYSLDLLELEQFSL